MASDSCYSLEEMVNEFGVSLEAIHRWINDRKIESIAVCSSEPEKEIVQFFIPKEQFERAERIIVQRLNKIRKIQELKKKIDWETFEFEDIFPSGT